MTPNAAFLSLSEELHVYILSFLPCRDILRCTAVCKLLRQMYMFSSELQYIVELSGQLLLPVPRTGNHTPVSERLQLLRDEAHAWFKVDIHSFETVFIPDELDFSQKNFASGHLYVCDRDEDSAVIMPILPKPPQQSIQRNWSPGTLRSVPNSTNLNVLMDLAQNLIAVVYIVDDERLHVDLRALESDRVHPQAVGQTLFMSELPRADDNLIETTGAKIKCFGRHIAVLRCLFVVSSTLSYKMWQLQIWDWQHSTESNSVLGDIIQRPLDRIDFCFLGNNRLLVVTHDLKLYSIGDMSQTPQLLACFLMPIPLEDTQCFLPMDDIEHSSEWQTQAQQTTHISDAKQRLLCITASASIFVVSTKIFFDLEEMVAGMPIPWNHWGPSNTRIFEHTDECKVYVSGNRVLQTFPVDTSVFSHSTKYVLHMMDFSPLAVTNRKGLGRVVKEPSSVVQTFCSTLGKFEVVTTATSLPYVEVVWDRKFGFGELEDIWLDRDRIYLLKAGGYREGADLRAPQLSRLEVIDI
ncbi:hypothetical protein DEU56DRAFT_912485 [Suillus clintonianus]|uniref:uncharacterized protein n=1 Tax=Suillus clintonianus TaxID=1904413 RepID=UPI001B86F2C3|nr:uncharacterized protein DEU56DRAFT_912485 [Suillus clintonianus]KAG2138328.1 hypothetical protein DEU56DRAFT_912485 [Suillus clintonianus]